ncbi:hypothetical protein EAY71_25920 [Vibrio anguillarum]|uniref:hypothetical protein n=1 Tax=Vibrio anguillarum TaxID=55601 RepID=UPI00188B1A53|nr:hypothetical protein [Vibrio anguillarum]MBF4228160.1 hypothetical protein [Vibrio anguillarum]MBF4249568.1 hypothetical protein [Vibrio anguillarum]MBF4270303.1 hypothetical protein [Vibrio anguillarum]MBF4306902.1 hypothetical protein [Vibrio anguillarum]
MNKNLEMKKLIGDLEMMAAAAEPGVVVTEEMSVSCYVTLLKAANELRRRLNGEKGVYTP